MSDDGLGLPPPAELKRAGEDELASLAALLAKTGPGQSVHGARRRIKQLRSLLRLLRRSLGEDAWQAGNAALRQAAGALAGHRRAEALVMAAGKLKGAAGFWLEIAESYRDAHAADGDPAAALSAASAALESARFSLASATLFDDCGAETDAALLSTYAKARKLLRRGFESGDPEELHEARKFVIHHLHHLKLLLPAGHKRILNLEQLREALGDLNDLAELHGLAQPCAAAEEQHRRLDKARRRLMGRAEDLGERLFRRPPGAYAKHLRHATRPRSADGKPALI